MEKEIIINESNTAEVNAEIKISEETIEMTNENVTISSNEQVLENAEEELNFDAFDDSQNADFEQVEEISTENQNNAAEVNNEEIKEETIEMKNEETTTNNVMTNAPAIKVEWIADPATRANTEAQFKALGLAFEWIRPKVKTALTIDATTGLATCPVCGKVFNVDEYSVEMQKRAHASGLCQNCIEQYDRLRGHMGKKSTAKNVTGEREIVNGGQAAGERIRAAFKSAVDNGKIDDELVQNMQDKIWTKETLGLKYALLKDITDCTPEEIRVKLYEDNKNGKTNARYLSRTKYEINGRQYIITNDMYTKDLAKVQKAFRTLGLIDENQEI